MAVKSQRFWTSRICSTLCWWAAAAAMAAGAPGLSHPLDPLTKQEIAEAVELLKSSGRVGNSIRLPMIALREPPKEEVLSYQPGAEMRREAFLAVYDAETNRTFEVIVDLKKGSILSWEEIPGVQPPYMPEETRLVTRIVRSDPQWQEAMRKRGITDFENVEIGMWPAGYHGNPEETGFRWARAVSYYRGDSKNPWARPIEGVVAYVNLNTREIFSLIDTGVIQVPKDPGDYGTTLSAKPRTPAKTLQPAQSAGLKFQVRGNEIYWENWRFRFAMHPREGLVLYMVRYEDRGKLRSVLYRASLSELIVPYGDPGPTWFFRNLFDQGEFGLGTLANSFDPLVEAPNSAVFFNATFANSRGFPYERSRVVALFERDSGLLWKHFDMKTGHSEYRKARELVLSCIFTVGNYEYGLNWIFHQDGVLELEVLLTGIMLTKGVKTVQASRQVSGNSEYGTLVAPNLVAVNHQHFFNFRLDLDVDGLQNSIKEVNTEAVPEGPANPHGNAFLMKETLFRREKEAQRNTDPFTNREWKVINPTVKNALGEPVAYALLPGENSLPFAAANSWIRRRAGFLDAHLWVTPYDPKQTYAAGDYPNQSRGGDGLPQWTKANRPIENRDIVLWYTVGVTHVPHPEEWPIMRVNRAGFRLIPSGFFSRNPILDAPNAEVSPLGKHKVWRLVEWMTGILKSFIETLISFWRSLLLS